MTLRLLCAALLLVSVAIFLGGCAGLYPKSQYIRDYRLSKLPESGSHTYEDAEVRILVDIQDDARLSLSIDNKTDRQMRILLDNSKALSLSGESKLLYDLPEGQDVADNGRVVTVRPFGSVKLYAYPKASSYMAPSGRTELLPLYYDSRRNIYNPQGLAGSDIGVRLMVEVNSHMMFYPLMVAVNP